MADNSIKFSFTYFLIKLTSRKFIALLASSAVVFIILWNNGGDYRYILALVRIWGIALTAYILGEPFLKAITAAFAKAIENAEIKFHKKWGGEE